MSCTRYEDLDQGPTNLTSYHYSSYDRFRASVPFPKGMLMYMIHTTRTNWEQLCGLSRALFVNEPERTWVRQELLYEPAFMTRFPIPWHVAVSNDTVIRGFQQKDRQPYCWRCGEVTIAARKVWSFWCMQVAYEASVTDNAQTLALIGRFVELPGTSVEMIPSL